MSYETCFCVMVSSNVNYSSFIKTEKIKSNESFRIERYCDFIELKYIAIPKNINISLISDIVIKSIEEIIRIPFEIIKNHSRAHASNKYTYLVLSDFIKLNIPIVAIKYHDISIKLISSIYFTFKLYFNSFYLIEKEKRIIISQIYNCKVINYETYKIKNEFEIFTSRNPIKIYISLKPKKYIITIELYNKNLCFYQFSDKSDGFFYHEIKDIAGDGVIVNDLKLVVKLNYKNYKNYYDINGFLYIGYYSILQVGSGMLNKII